MTDDKMEHPKFLQLIFIHYGNGVYYLSAIGAQSDSLEGTLVGRHGRFEHISWGRDVA